MAGTVDVYSFQLLGPDHPISIGRPATLHGIAPGRDGRGADRVPRAHGHGVGAGHRRRPRARRLVPRAGDRPAAPTVYRAVTDAGPSLPLPLKVGARARHDASSG